MPPPTMPLAHTHTVFNAAPFTTVRMWKQPKCPSTDEWIKKMRYIHAMAYYSAIKKNEMPDVATWTGLEVPMPSEKSLTEKNKYHLILLMKVKEESEKVGLKPSIQKTKIMASGPITS